MDKVSNRRTLRDGLDALFELTQQRIADGVRSPATLEMQRAHGRWLEQQLGAELELDQVDEQVLEQLVGRARTFGPNTLRKRLSTLRAVVALAHRRRWVPRVPAFPQVIAPFRPRRRHLRRYSDAVALYETLRPHRGLWMWLALWTGQHASDVERMTWEEVDLDPSRPSMLIRNTKNGRVEGLRVRMPRPLWKVLRAHWEREQPRPADRIVRPWPSRSTTLMRACLRVGLQPLNAIDFRHTCFSWAVRRLGITPAVVSWAGHSSPAMMARTYAHALPAGLAEVACELDSVAEEPEREGDRP